MARHKAFQAARSEASAEDLSFTIEGQRKGEPHEETFRCMTVAPAASLLDLTASVSEGEIHAVTAVMPFLRSLIVEEDRERFDEMLRSDFLVPIETIVAVMNWLIEELVGVPFAQLSASPSGP